MITMSVTDRRPNRVKTSYAISTNRSGGGGGGGNTGSAVEPTPPPLGFPPFPPQCIPLPQDVMHRQSQQAKFQQQQQDPHHFAASPLIDCSRSLVTLSSDSYNNQGGYHRRTSSRGSPAANDLVRAFELSDFQMQVQDMDALQRENQDNQNERDMNNKKPQVLDYTQHMDE